MNETTASIISKHLPFIIYAFSVNYNTDKNRITEMQNLMDVARTLKGGSPVEIIIIIVMTK